MSTSAKICETGQSSKRRKRKKERERKERITERESMGGVSENSVSPTWKIANSVVKISISFLTPLDVYYFLIR